MKKNYHFNKNKSQIMKTNYKNYFSVLALTLCSMFSQYSNAQTAPTTAPASPPARNASDVISIYGDTYTNVAGVRLDANWGESTVQTVETIAGNEVIKYAGFTFQG